MTLSRSMIIDTDAFWDPDDLLAITLAAMLVRRLTVITSNETGGRRARGLRRFLNSLGRIDVPVVAGCDLGDTHRFNCDDYIEDVPEQPADVLGAVARACAAERAIWVGQGPLSNLANVLSAEPHRSDQLDVLAQGGWLDEYRDPSAATFNFRLDPAAAGLAVRAANGPRLVLSDWTNAEEMAVTRESDLFRIVSQPGAPEWARWIAICLERWFDRKPSSKMHDPLTLSVALGLPFVDFTDVRVRIEADARLYRDRRGRLVRVANGVDYAGFMGWLCAIIETGITEFDPGAACLEAVARTAEVTA
ncbi:nucleoside hydrolase [Nocardia sp. BMG51109]|uniref:nucleoside hydrolase n=1 Tax=Nocardia sp. BMG51109 TaxID=1056816 RepID=UPI000463F907|nr:nucleoside hydrolase [Nocardia sp. BMG51109]